MAPVLSPKKSIEGAIGGIAGATALGVIYGSIVSTRMTEELVSPCLLYTSISGYVRFEVGEGLEKKSEDFAAEVAAQLGN